MAKRLLGRRWAWPLDGGRKFVDGRPLLGPLLFMHFLLDVPWRVVVATTIAFVLLEPPLAQLTHRLGLREQPY